MKPTIVKVQKIVFKKLKLTSSLIINQLPFSPFLPIMLVTFSTMSWFHCTGRNSLWHAYNLQNPLPKENSQSNQHFTLTPRQISVIWFICPSKLLWTNHTWTPVAARVTYPNPQTTAMAANPSDIDMVIFPLYFSSH